jgi:GT2 family glycosyltransferase
MASGEEGLFPTCNVAYRRAAFEEAGGFDGRAGGRFGFRNGTSQHDLGFGEDTLLGWRVARAGRWTYAPDAVVVHHTFRSDWRDTVRRTWMMRAFPALYRECPELRGTPLTTQGIQIGRRTRVPMYATALALGARRPRAAAIAAAAWLAYSALALRGRPGSRRDRLRNVPVDLALDGGSGAALVTGSVQQRSLVL